jgi:hypothetical protein
LRAVAIAVVAVVVFGCGSSGGDDVDAGLSAGSGSERILTSTVNETPDDVSSVPDSPRDDLDPAANPCEGQGPRFYTWSYQDQDARAARLADALEQAGLDVVVAEVVSFGEVVGAVDSAGEAVQCGFLAMETDFRVHLSVASVDGAALAEHLETLVATITKFDRGPGEMEALFSADGGVAIVTVTTDVQSAAAAHDSGLTGTDLLTALGVEDPTG